MFTLALAARAVDTWAGGPGRVRELGCKFTKPVVVPDDDTGVEVRGRRHRQGGHRRRRPAVADGHLRRREGAGHAASGAGVPERLADLTTLRIGGPARELVHATHRAAAAGRRSGRGRSGHAPAAARGRQQPRRGGRGLRRHRRPGRDDRHRRRRGRRRRPGVRWRDGQGRGGGAVGPVRRARRRGRAGPASRRCPGSPAASARRRCRTSGPTARRSPTPSRPSAAGTGWRTGSGPSPPPTAGSATAPASSSRTRSATSCST